MTSDNLVCVGVIGSPHGVKGALKIKSFTEDEVSIFDFSKLFYENGETCEINHIGQSGNALLANIANIEDRNSAELMKGKKIYALRADFPETSEDEFYIEDLIGLSVKLEDGRLVGKVKNVANYGAGDVVEIIFNNGTDDLYNFSQATFPHVDLTDGSITFIAPEFIEAKKD